MGAKPMPWLAVWKSKWGILAERKMKIASAIGTEFHRCVESYIETGSYAVFPPIIGGNYTHVLGSTMPRIRGMMQSFVAWAANVDGIIHSTELKIISHKYRYSGTLDAVGKLGKKLVVIDWKTGSRIYEEMQLQLAAYAQAYNERLSNKEWVELYTDGSSVRYIKDGLIVHVSKDKPHFKLTTKEFKLGKRPFKQFLKLREMFDAIKAKENVDAEANKSEASGC
jgi:hypothetical protein